MNIFEKLIIAEIGSVHDGSLGNAMRLIDLAKTVGAGAVKFQTHLADFEVTTEALNPQHFSEESRHEYFRRTGFSSTEWKKLKNHADDVGITFLSSVFSSEAVDLLEDLGVIAHKVPSGELTNPFLLKRIAQTNKPVILSTGMNNWAEIDSAFELVSRGESGNTAILQCTSAYPCPPTRVGLNVISELQTRYGAIPGFSDHTHGAAAPIAAAALGAQVIEKHLTFSTRMYGSDAPFAMEPDQFQDMVSSIREVWEMMSFPADKDNLVGLDGVRSVFQGVLVASRQLSVNQVLGMGDITLRKAGDGLGPQSIDNVLGARLTRSKRQSEKIELGDVTFG